LDDEGYMTNRRARKVILAILAVAMLLLATVGYAVWHAGSKVAPGVTKEKLLSVRLGLEEQDLASRLGQPLRKDRVGDGDGTEDAGVVDWIYAEANSFGLGYKIHIRLRGRHVASVEVKRDDLGVYICTLASCPDFLGGDARSLDGLPHSR
jgi:hypothetical protein